MRKAKRGDALNIRAGDWNRLCDLAGPGLNQSPGSAPDNAFGIVYVKNTLGRDLERYAAVCVGSPVLAVPMNGKNDPIFSLVNGSLRAQGQSDPVIGILQEPIAQNRFGRVQVSGITPASFINTEGNTGGVNNNMPECATISDDKDMLAFLSVWTRSSAAAQPIGDHWQHRRRQIHHGLARPTVEHWKR